MSSAGWMPLSSRRSGLMACVFVLPGSDKIIGPYDPAVGNYMSPNVQTMFIVVLGVFQGLLLMWLYELLYSIYRALSGEPGDKKKKEK